MKIYLSHSSNFNYQDELYVPLKQNLTHKYTVFYPHDSENVDSKSKNIIAECDCVLAEISYPSTGQGIELGWAEIKRVPIICLYRNGSNYSKSLHFVSDHFIEYKSPDEIPRIVETFLANNKNVL